MNIFNAFLDVLKNKYAAFDGRARRREYWSFYVVILLVIFVAMLVDQYVVNPNFLNMTPEEAKGGGLLTAISGLALMVPHIAVTIRRLHDTDRSGWWALPWAVIVSGLIQKRWAINYVCSLIKKTLSFDKVFLYPQ